MRRCPCRPAGPRGIIVKVRMVSPSAGAAQTHKVPAPPDVPEELHELDAGCKQTHAEESMEKVLTGVVAIRRDIDEELKKVWANWRADSSLFSCPIRGCPVKYNLLVSKQASDKELKDCKKVLPERIRREHPNHADYIKF